MDHDNLADLGGRSDRVATVPRLRPVGRGRGRARPLLRRRGRLPRRADDGRAHLRRAGRPAVDGARRPTALIPVVRPTTALAAAQADDLTTPSGRPPHKHLYGRSGGRPTGGGVTGSRRAGRATPGRTTVGPVGSEEVPWRCARPRGLSRPTTTPPADDAAAARRPPGRGAARAPRSRPRPPSPAATSRPPPSSGSAAGRSAFMKTLTNAPAGFFEAEAAGLRWLGEAGGVRVPEVLAVEPDCLILAWVEPGKLTTEAAGEFGRALAKTHDAGAPAYGLDRDGFIGRLPAAQQDARRRGRSSTRPSGSCPTSSSPATAARSRPRRPRRSRASSAGSPTWCPRRGRAASTATCGTATSSGPTTAAAA